MMNTLIHEAPPQKKNKTKQKEIEEWTSKVVKFFLLLVISPALLGTVVFPWGLMVKALRDVFTQNAFEGNNLFPEQSKQTEQREALI